MQNAEVVTLLKDAFELKRQSKYKRAMELLYKALSICPDNVEILIQVSELHMLLKNASSACSILERLLEKEPNNVLVFEMLVANYVTCYSFEKARVSLSKFILAYPSEKAYEIYLKNLVLMKDYKEAIDFYNEKHLEELNSDYINKQYSIALCNDGRLDEAKVLFEQIFSHKVTDEELKYYYARTLYILGDEAKAYEIVMKLVKDAQRADVFNLAGELEMNKARIESAISLFSVAVKKHPLGLYLYNLGSAYFINGQMNEAKHFYTKAIASSSHTLEYRYALAYLYYKQNNIVKAKQVLDYILSFDAEHKEAMLLQAQIMYDENHFIQAQEVLNKMDSEDVLTNKDYLYLSYKTAIALYKQEKALGLITRLVELCPKEWEYAIELAKLCYQRADYSTSLQTAENIIMEAPNYSPAYVVAAQNYLKQELYDKAQIMVDKALKTDLNNSEAIFVQAQIYSELKQYDRAIETAKMLLEYMPNEADYYMFLASIYEAKGSLEDAIKYCNEAININSQDSDYFVKLAQLYDKQDSTSDVIRYLYIAFTLSPKNQNIILSLATAYVKEHKYKEAMKFLKERLSKDSEIKKQSLLVAKLEDIDALYKKEVNPLVYQLWHVFGV